MIGTRQLGSNSNRRQLSEEQVTNLSPRSQVSSTSSSAVSTSSISSQTNSNRSSQSSGSDNSQAACVVSKLEGRFANQSMQPLLEVPSAHCGAVGDGNDGNLAQLKAKRMHEYVHFYQKDQQENIGLLQEALSQQLPLSAKLMVGFNRFDQNLLHLLANGNHTATLQSLLHYCQQHFPPSLLQNMLNQVDRNGQTPLHTACRATDWAPKQVKLLLDAGANIDVKDSLGRTIWIAYNSKSFPQPAMLALLLSHNCQVNQGYRGLTGVDYHRIHRRQPDKQIEALFTAYGAKTGQAIGQEFLAKLERARLHQQPAVFTMLARQGDGIQPSSLLTCLKQPEVASTLLAALLQACPEQLEQPDFRGFTPLHQLLLQYQSPSHRQAIGLLLQAGADPNNKGGVSVNAVHLAIERAPHDVQLFALLLAHGGDTNISRDGHPIERLVGWAPKPDQAALLQVLARYGHKATAKPVIDGNTNYHSAHTSS